MVDNEIPRFYLLPTYGKEKTSMSTVWTEEISHDQNSFINTGIPKNSKTVWNEIFPHGISIYIRWK